MSPTTYTICDAHQGEIEITDYNGLDEWSVEAVRERYMLYAQRLGILSPLNLESRRSGYDPYHQRWIHPLMEAVIQGVQLGDLACIEIAVEFIESKRRFCFGRVLKAKTARALRRASLSQPQVERVRHRIVGMLLAEQVPREYQQYAKMLRKIGFGPWWPVIERNVNRDNPFVMRYYNSYRQIILNSRDKRFRW